MVTQVFISYARKDGSNFANRLYSDLHSHGINVWLDTKALKPGEKWNKAIDKALNSAEIILIVLTPHAVNSDQVESEWSYAKEKGKELIPLLLEECDIPRTLRMIQRIDFSGDYVVALEQLLERLNGQDKPVKQPAPVRLSQKDENKHPRIRVLVVDDHHMVRKGLIVLLENFDDFEVVGDASDGQAGVMMAQRYKPDIVLMDMAMPSMDGVTATQLIRESCPDTQVIGLTSFSDASTVQAVLKAGASSYLLKNVSVDELAEAVRRTHQGKVILSSEAAQSLIDTIRHPAEFGSDLSERELEVLTWLVEGLNNREIAERLMISNSTVKNHLSNIFSKMGTTSRTQAVALAVEHKLVTK